MESLGKLLGVARNWQNGKLQVTFELEQDVTGFLDDIKDVLLTVTAKRFRAKRSLDANAYYWQLLTKLADCLRVSKPYLHNLMLRKYGQDETIDGQLIYVVLPESDAAHRKADEEEMYHLKPTSEVKSGTDGRMYRTYRMLRGSSTYDTKEMSTLINGLVDACKEQGIETLPPEEFDRMMQMYDEKWRKKHEEAV